MTDSLLVISIGPVQDFIAAARRTRDLWFGSHMLSEISKSTAQAVADNGGELVFPSASLLEREDSSVANLILAVVPSGTAPETVAEAARTMAAGGWKDFAEKASRNAGKIIDSSIWNQQLDDVLEFFVAWTPLVGESDGSDGSESTYRKSRRRLMQLLSGRKALRDFQNANGIERIPKSSLDGLRESVLVREGGRDSTGEIRKKILESDAGLAQLLRLSTGEELDIVGLTKRAAENVSFPSIVRVAIDPWIRGVSLDEKGEPALKAIADKCQGSRFATGGTQCKELYPQFPFDGGILFQSRTASMIGGRKSARSDYGFDNTLRDQDIADLKEIRNMVNELEKSEASGGFGKPEPYFAVLVADGDRIGSYISNIDSKERHKDFSQDLAGFAGSVGDIVRKHHGSPIYSGGDDVMAFLPLDTCLDCAEELHEQFSKSLDGWRDENDKPPTLSVGVAIGHCLEPMEDLINHAHTAERAAKEAGSSVPGSERNGLAIHEYSRGGAPIRLNKERWDHHESAGNQKSRIIKWANLHVDDQLPSKLAYDLRGLSYIYDNWAVETDEDRLRLSNAIRADAIRMIRKKKGGISDEAFADLQVLLEDARDAEGVRFLAEEIMVARRIGRAIRQSSPGRISVMPA